MFLQSQNAKYLNLMLWEKMRLLTYFQKPQINPQIIKGWFLTSTVNSIRAIDYCTLAQRYS